MARSNPSKLRQSIICVMPADCFWQICLLAVLAT
jgi:hypothetical protein